MDGKVIAKDAGTITSYGYALDGGLDPTVTEQDYAELMASYATVAQRAAESAQSASQSAQSASQSATDAETAKGTAQQAATDAQTAQASAQGYAQSAQQSAQSASQSATDAESAKNTAVNAVDGFAAGAQQALDSVNQAGINWKSLAQAKALDSEAYALGTRDGEDIGGSDPAYHNNAKYYAQQGSASAQTASDAAQTATTKAEEAQASASAAAESARTLTIDSTLTQSGQAADSKVVRDAIGSLNDHLSDVQGAIGYKEITTWNTGYIQTVAEGQTANLTRTTFGTLSFIIADCVKGQHFVINGTPRNNSGTRPCMFVDKNNVCKYRSNETAEMVNYEIVAPCDGKLVVNLLNANPYSVRSGYADISANVSNLEDIVGITPIKFTDGYYITTKAAGQTLDSLTPQSSTLTKYALIDCYAKERIVISGTPTNNSGRALYMFVDANLKVLERGPSDGVAVEDMVLTAPADCKLAINFLLENPCSGAIQFMNMGKTVSENEAASADYKSFKSQPLTKLPDYILNNMAFKPLGALDKGYMVLVTDDGCEDGSLGICSFTIPLAIEKDVPFTFSLMSTSDVFTNQTWTDTLLDAITNHGCSIAQHGVRRFSTYGEQELVQFFDSEKEFFDSKGIELHGAVCPAHCINKMVMAVAGGRFGVVRSGYFGGTTEDKAQYNGIDLSNFYDYYTSGANSNKYGLSCFNIAAKSLDYSKSAIDYAYANNKILIALYHEFSSDLPDAGTKQKVADVIDYAKAKGMTFITLGDIEKLPFASTRTW